MHVPATERRQQLIEAAVRLMARDGMDAATLRAIAKEAGAPLATVHYCFTDKDELMSAASEHWLGELVGSMTGDVISQGGLRATVKEMADQWWADLERNPANVLAQHELDLWAIRGTEHQALAKSIYPRYVQALTSVFTRALHSAGEQSSIPPELLARAFLAILDGASFQYLANPESRKARDLLHLLIDALLLASGV
jgi:AcrR family transcriptional regulator